MKKLLFVPLLLACCSVHLSSADDEPRTIRDQNGKIIGRIDDTANGRVIRDENGKIIGRMIHLPRQNSEWQQPAMLVFAHFTRSLSGAMKTTLPAISPSSPSTLA